MTPEPNYDLRMGAVDSLVLRAVKEIRYFGSSDLRLVFDPGDKSEPALYADVGVHTFTDREGTVHLVRPDEPASVGPVLSIVGAVVEAADVEEDGALVLRFSDGSVIRCEPSEVFEAWQVVGGKPEHLVVCTPGGEIAVWSH